MANKPEDGNWSKVDSLVQRNTVKETQSIVGSTSVPPLATVDTIQGVIAKFKANRIQKRAALDAMQLAATAQIDVFSHQLQEAARTKKAEATVLAEQFITQLDAQYQEVLNEIGVRNEGARRETLMKLNDETARDLKEIVNKDWPQFMVEETINLIKTRYSKFLERLNEDLEDRQEKLR